MSYAAGEAAILTLIRAISPTTWTATNSVSLANDTHNQGMTLLQSGKSHHYVMLDPAAFQLQTEDVGFNTYLVKWVTVIRLFALDETKHPPKKTLADDRQAIIDQLMKYERLNNLAGVMHAQIGSGGPVTTERVGRGPTNKKTVFFKQEVMHLWEEKVAVTQQD